MSTLQKLFSELLGAALLLAIVIGSGIMGERLAGGNVAVALVVNTLSTIGGLYILIEVSGPISGAYLSPAASAVMAYKGESFAGVAPSSVPAFVAAQFVGAAVAVAIHTVFAGAAVAPEVEPRPNV